MSSFSSGATDSSQVNSALAFVPSQEAHISDGQTYFYEGFEDYPNSIEPWSGQLEFLWLVFESFPNTGMKALHTGSRESSIPSWVISPRFTIPPEQPDLVIEAFLALAREGVTWQFVPQGSDFVMARLIIYPNGQAAIFDAETGPDPIRLPFYFDLTNVRPFVKCTFILERNRNRYSLFLNDQKMYTGTPFTTDIEYLVFFCNMEVGSRVMIVDDVSVRPLPRNVPTLQGWALIAMISCMLAAALWQRRRLRRCPSSLITDR